MSLAWHSGRLRGNRRNMFQWVKDARVEFVQRDESGNVRPVDAIVAGQFLSRTVRFPRCTSDRRSGAAGAIACD